GKNQTRREGRKVHPRGGFAGHFAGNALPVRTGLCRRFCAAIRPFFLAYRHPPVLRDRAGFADLPGGFSRILVLVSSRRQPSVRGRPPIPPTPSGITNEGSDRGPWEWQCTGGWNRGTRVSRADSAVPAFRCLALLALSRITHHASLTGRISRHNH